MSNNEEDQTGGLKNSAGPEEPPPARLSSNTSRDDGSDKDTDKVCPKVKRHGSSPLVDKQQVAYDHRHERFVGSSPEARENAGTDEAGKGCYQSLPDICENTDCSANDDNGPPAETVCQRYDDKVGIAERYGGNTEL